MPLMGAARPPHRNRAQASSLVLLALAPMLVARVSAQQVQQQTAPASEQPSPKNTETLPGVKILAPSDAEGILGQKVWSVEGADMGIVVDVLVDRGGTPAAAVIDFGGFLGVGSRRIAIAWWLIHFDPGNAKYPVLLDLGRDALRSAPEYQPGRPAKIVGGEPPAPRDLDSRTPE